MRWLAIPAVLAIVAGLFALGYLWFGVLRWDSQSGQIAFGVIGVAYGFGCAALLPRLVGNKPRKRLSGADRARIERQQADSAREWRERKAGRIAELQANPAMAAYAAMAEKGDLITDFEIAYLEDPQASLACPHLRHIEQAMRAAGVHVRPIMKYTGEFANGLNCGVALDYERLKEQFALPPAHEYTDFEDHHGGDGAYLRCKCGFMFNTDYMRANTTRIFPRPDSWADAYR